MRQGFRPLLEPTNDRKAVVEARRPCLCLTLTLIMILLVFGIFGVCAWNVYQHRFHVNAEYYHPNDEVSLSEVSNDLSTIFCDGYNVQMMGPGQVYLLPQQATVNTSSFDTTYVALDQMAFGILNVRVVYLLTGSIVDVTACREVDAGPSDARIVLIKGDYNFQEWRGDSDCVHCVVNRTDIAWNDNCNSQRENARLYHKVQNDDVFYLVVYFGRPRPLGQHPQGVIRLRGEIYRTQFDVRNAERVCTGMNCYFDLPWRSQKDIVVKFFGGFSSERRDFTTQCQHRVIFWVGLFGFVPVVVVIPISLAFGWFMCRRTKRNARALRRSQEQRRSRASRRRGEKANFVTQHEDYGSVAIQDE